MKNTRLASGLPFWTCTSMTLLSAVVSAGYSIVGIVGPTRENIALYATSRSVALLIAVLVAAAVRSRSGTLFLAGAMSLVQLLDGLIGIQLHDPAKSYGPFAFAAINALLMVWLRRSHQRIRTDARALGDLC
jgi:hypothetical protein